MERNTLFEIKALYRDNFRVTGFTFGSGDDSICIVGSMRGNENQQLYACSKLVKKLSELEQERRIRSGKKILIIPCVNPYSVNIRKRFWTIDNTDINRMFPGYSLGETTQRISAGVFEAIKNYKYGIQFASFYMPGIFLPHVRMMKTGYENIDLAKEFGLPYVVLHNPRPFDTTTLNYNWQVWGTNAFSIYTTTTAAISESSADQAVEAILNFMSKQDIIDYRADESYISKVVDGHDIISVRTKKSGFFMPETAAGKKVKKGSLLAKLTDTYTGELKDEIYSPVNGTIFFMHDAPMVYSNTAVFKIIQAE